MTPRVIKNSGGRTSGVLTWLEMQKGLGPDDYVVFCNTGKEAPGTLDFLHKQETVLGFPLIWLERCHINKWKRVTYETASRNGEPFTQLILERRYIPNGFARFCTSELKIRVVVDFMRSMGHSHFEALIGIRADEPKRYHAGKKSGDKWHEPVHPLYHAGITEPDVRAFWKRQPFDLELNGHEGNCDNCFQKGLGKRLDNIRRNPSSADWWDDAEQVIGHPFDKRYSMADLKRRATQQTTLDFLTAYDEPSRACGCSEEDLSTAA